MVDLAAGVFDIINDPMSHGIGAGIGQEKVVTKTQPTKITVPKKQTTTKKNTVQAVTKNTGTTKVPADIQDILNSSAPAQRLDQAIFGSNNGNYISTLVNEMLDATISKKLQAEIKAGRLSLKTSQLGKTYAIAVSYYKKLYDGSLIMTQLRNKTEKKISDLINKRINDKIFSWQKNLGDFGKILLSKSKLASSLRISINNEIHTAITSLVSDKMISGINDALLGNLKKISDTVQTTINTQFKSQIEYFIKLRSIVQEKIVAFMELKKEYEKKIADAIKSLTNKIGEAIHQFTQKMVDSLSGSVKSLVSGNKLA